MRSIEKNRKHRTTAYLPISIKSAGKISLVVLGYVVWGYRLSLGVGGLVSTDTYSSGYYLLVGGVAHCYSRSSRLTDISITF